MSSFPTSMNAICVSKFGGPEVLELKTIPVPKLQPNQVLVRVHAAGVNPVETYMRSGHYARLPTLPWTPGNDGAGVIVAVCSAGGSLTTSSRSSPNSPASSLSSSPKSPANNSSSSSSSSSSCDHVIRIPSSSGRRTRSAWTAGRRTVATCTSFLRVEASARKWTVICSVRRA